MGVLQCSVIPGTGTTSSGRHNNLDALHCPHSNSAELATRRHCFMRKYEETKFSPPPTSL